MSHRRLPSVALFLASFTLVASACVDSSGGPGGSPSGESDASQGAIDHKTGATDVLLRLSTGGGFVPADFAASEAPTFSLYGDGTVLFRDPTAAPPPPPANSSLMPGIPFRRAALDEAQIQSLLEFAIGQGGLGLARPKYDLPTVADAPFTTFEIHAGGVDKTVEVYALGIGTELSDTPDLQIRRAFQALADRLANFDQGGAFPTEVYVPTAYRGVLFETGGVNVPDIREWPWTGLRPGDFAVPANPVGPGMPRRVMTAEEVAALNVGDQFGGVRGIYLTGPGDGKLYGFALRPLLPDETE